MSQLQAQVPDPLTDDLPCLLPPGGVRAPAVRVDFLILIGKRRFKGTARQIQTRLHERMIKDRVLLAAGYEGETCQVRKHSPGAILAIEPQQGTLGWDLVRCEVAR